jgi:stage II sporulation protein D
LQPVAVLRGKGVLESTVRHELLHVLVETQAKAGLPVWFREGVVGYLERRHGGGADLTEGDIRQTTDEARARRAYAAAAQRVTELVQRHGAATVLSWLKTGIP